jgi:hypothetical protein
MPMLQGKKGDDAITGLLEMRIPLQCFRLISGCNYKLTSAPEASPMGNKV